MPLSHNGTKLHKALNISNILSEILRLRDFVANKFFSELVQCSIVLTYNTNNNCPPPTILKIQ
jgi:hypothetical protein